MINVIKTLQSTWIRGTLASGTKYTENEINILLNMIAG